MVNPSPFGASAQAMQDLQEPVKIDTQEAMDQGEIKPLTFGTDTERMSRKSSQALDDGIENLVPMIVKL